MEIYDNGVLVYVRGHEGRGLDLVKKLEIYDVQQKFNLDTNQANLHFGYKTDYRNYTEINDIVKENVESIIEKFNFFFSPLVLI